MHLYRSNRMERLVDALGRVIGAAPLGPFETETIVVQSKGMERWLSMELSSRLGVWANAEFPFPRTLLSKVFDALISPSDAEERARTAFSPEVMTFTVARLLPRFAGSKGFEAIDRYLEGDRDASLRLQLAERVAGCLDQYAVYRPDMVERWARLEERDEEAWQAAIWRALVEEGGDHHMAARARAFVEAMSAEGASASGLPSRISFFGIASLPPQHLEILDVLSRHVEVHLFLLSPSSEYWADIRSGREQAAAMRRAGATRDADEELHFDEGHPLLASFGRLGRELSEIIEERVAYTETADLYADPEPSTLLKALQHDILHLQRRGEGEANESFVLADDDSSIGVHSCHGKMRELEVLADRLYDLFEDETLRPRDVIVMTPDVEAYAPMVEAVFERSKIPYRIADRGLLTTHPVVDAFVLAVRVLEGRVRSRDVMELLGAAPVRARFGIELDELETLRRWVSESGIRWGVDAEHRASTGQPEAAQNTWRFGLDRLLLGYAMSGEGERLFGGVLPYDELGGVGGGLLGRFVEFCDELFGQREALLDSRPLTGWSDTLGSLLDAIVGSPKGTEGEHAMVRQALDRLAGRAESAGFEEAVDLRTAMRLVESELERELPAHGFLSGGVTFCQLVPMRSIPFEVVAILGLDDDAFPRSQRPLGFDLMSARPRTGDRSVRNDDRHMFLEALLSARRHLILSYVGQSIDGHRRLPPSVVLGELVDELVRMSRLPDGGVGDAVRERLVLHHPLTAFNPDYFIEGSDPRLFSYSEPHRRGASAILSPSVVEPPFLQGPLPDDEEESATEISLAELASFVQRPVRWLMQRRLGLYLDERSDALETREPLALDGLSGWKIGDELLRLEERGIALDDAERLVRARGDLALGTPGEIDFQGLLPVVAELASMRSELAGEMRSPLPVELRLGEHRLVGSLSGLGAERAISWQYSKISARHELGLWIRHLTLCAVDAPSTPRESVLIGRDEKGRASLVRFSKLEVGEAKARLLELLELHREGRRWALPFFSEASRDYVVALLDPKKGEARGLSHARKAFEGDGHRTEGERGDPHVVRVYPDFDAVLDAPSPRDFDTLARLVFEPLLEHRGGA